MSWQVGAMLALGALGAIWLFAEIAHRMGRDDDRWDDEDYQWKLKRRIEQNGKRTRWGGR